MNECLADKKLSYVLAIYKCWGSAALSLGTGS